MCGGKRNVGSCVVVVADIFGQGAEFGVVDFGSEIELEVEFDTIECAVVHVDLSGADDNFHNEFAKFEEDFFFA